MLSLSIPSIAQEFDEEDREPAALPSKRNYPGGQDEEDLRVLKSLPESSVKTDASSIQKEVFRALYNQELREERQESMEE